MGAGVGALVVSQEQAQQPAPEKIKTIETAEHMAKIEVSIELAMDWFGEDRPTPEQATSKLLALGFPYDTKVLYISQSLDDMLKGYITLIVSHPDLYRVPEGGIIPIITPVMCKDYGLVRFKDWGMG